MKSYKGINCSGWAKYVYVRICTYVGCGKLFLLTGKYILLSQILSCL